MIESLSLKTLGSASRRSTTGSVQVAPPSVDLLTSIALSGLETLRARAIW